MTFQSQDEFNYKVYKDSVYLANFWWLFICKNSFKMSLTLQFLYDN